MPLKYIITGGALALLLLAVGLHIRSDNRMRDLVVELKVNLRTSEANYTKCGIINKDNADKAAAQQASIDRFATESLQDIKDSELIASKSATERIEYERKSTELRKQVRQLLRGTECADTVIPDPDVIRLLNDLISTASAG